VEVLVEKVYADVVAPLIAMKLDPPGALSYHWYEYGGVPEVMEDDVRLELCP
jgi:hypothetical protein